MKQMFSISKYKKNIYLILFSLLFIVLNSPINKAESSSNVWEYEGTVFYCPAQNTSRAKPVFRFWSPQKKAHFYTISENEKNKVINQMSDIWEYEAVVYYAFPTQVAGTSPVYRFWSPTKRVHFYTNSKAERDKVINQYGNTWRYEGIAFYAYSGKQSDSKNVFRFWSPTQGNHFYTASIAERDKVIKLWGAQEEETPDKSSLGPEIEVGILSYDKSYSKDHSFRIEANKDYIIKDDDGKTIADVKGDDETRVKYDGDGKLRIYKSIEETLVDKQIHFEAKDGNNKDMIFNIEPKTFDDYRGKLRIRYVDDKKRVWVINDIPLEQYTWGMGEITGTGPKDYNKLMTILYRTYGYWKIKYSTKYRDQGFIVDATAGNQVYYGYDWEESHKDIREAAEETWGKIVTYDDDVAITPYSSSTDGRTRSWEERWGSKNYQYCQSVPDPWGKVAGAGSIAGNHMVGVSATGALNQAKEKVRDYDEIIEYYYQDVDIEEIY